MRSCLYECSVLHARFSPRSHRFVYRIFLLALDLDELDALHRRLPLFSVNRPNLFSFRETDYLPTSEPLHRPSADIPPPGSPTAPSTPPSTLKQRVVAYLADRGVDLTGGRVLLVTMPRIAGYGFNPVSFYFCSDRHGTPVAALAEVTNTFREMKPYFLGPASRTAPQSPISASPAFHLRVPKHFYVSPFSDVDIAFDFTLRPPGDQLSIQIDDYVGANRTLTSALSGPRRALTTARLSWFAVKYPLLTLRVIVLIHWHALSLWLKRVPWFAKSARISDQRDLYRPHASLVPPSSDAA